MSSQTSGIITEDAARALIDEHGIKRLGTAFPACVTFILGNGARLVLWDAGYEHDRHWELER
jgi:hypothetical protein